MKKDKKHIRTEMLSLFAATLILVPIFTLVIWVFTERWAWPDIFPQTLSFRAIREVLGRKTQLLGIAGSSILISTIVGVLSIVIGTMTARALTFYQFVGRRWVSFFTVLPFLVPATVFAMGIQMTFIKLGLNNSVAGVVIAHLICSLPYAVRLIADGMEGVGRGLEEQARVLGASSGTAFARVTLPILAPVIVSALCMSYVVSFSQYFLTLLIGGGQVKTFTIVMVPYLQGGNRNIASVYSMLFLGITLMIFAVFEKIAMRWSRNSGEFYG